MDEIKIDWINISENNNESGIVAVNFETAGGLIRLN